MASTINSSTSNGIVITPDTSGEIELQANGVTKAKVTANGLQDANGASLRGGMYRNLIINGDMKIAQRGTSSSGITLSSGTYYTVDRMGAWMTSAGTWTMSQDTDVPTGQGFAKSMKWSCTTANASLSAGSYLHLTHNIEAQNCQALKFGSSSAESFTLSFWVKSNKTGTYVVEFHQDDAGKTLSKTYTIDSADTWEKKTVTVAGNTANVIVSDNGMGLQIWHWLLAGTNFSSGTAHSTWTTRVIANDAAGQTVNLADSTSNYINITGVQLEVGSGASDFEFLPYDVQLARCQRYYETSYNEGVTAGTASAQEGNLTTTSSSTTTNQMAGAYFAVRKRATPTCTAYNSVAGTSGGCYRYNDGSNIGLTFNNVGKYGIGRATLASGSANTYLWHFVANAEL